MACERARRALPAVRKERGRSSLWAQYTPRRHTLLRREQSRAAGSHSLSIRLVIVSVRQRWLSGVSAPLVIQTKTRAGVRTSRERLLRPS